MAREVTIAAVQLPAISKGKNNEEIREYNFQTAEDWLEKAGENEVDIACLGEGFNRRSIDIYQHADLTLMVKDDFEITLERLGKVARYFEMYIVAPILGILDEKLRNLAMLIDRGGNYIGSYLKVHCTMDERKLGIEAGNHWPVFELDFGYLGIQICHDNSFPESARSLALNGAEIIFWPHMMSGWGEDFMNILLRSPAVHNGIIFVPVCYGYDPGIAWRPGQMMIGRSSIIRPDATIMVDAGHQTGMAIAKVDLDLPRIAHDFTRQGNYAWQPDMLRDRRPDTYNVITKPVKPIPGNASAQSPDSQKSHHQEET